MNKFVFVCFFAVMAVAINAQRPGQSGRPHGRPIVENEEYTRCAAEKWTNMFDNITFIAGIRECVKDINTYQTRGVNRNLRIIEALIAKYEKYYTETEDSTAKYVKLYRFADAVLINTRSIRRMVNRMDDSIKSCVDPEIVKAETRIGNAQDCRDIIRQTRL